MFAVKRYTNDQGESTFIPTFNGKPAQDIPQGYTEAQESRPAEGSTKVLQRAGLGARTDAASILQTRNISAEGVLSSAGIQPTGKAPEPSDAFKQQQEALTQQSQTQVKQETAPDPNRLVSTEPPDKVTASSVDHITSQLRQQYNAIQQGSGYRYKNENELDSIFSGMAAKLAVSGINDIRDLGVEEVTTDPTQRTIKNIRERDGEYFYLDESSDSPTEIKIDPASIQDLRKTQVDAGQDFESTRIEADVLEGGGTKKFLINKVTGKRLQDVAFTSPQFRRDLEASGEFSTGLAKKRGDLALEDRQGFTRWGKDLSVDGQADYAIQFVDGNPVMMPVWKDTKTDLTPYMMMASIALMGAGIPGQIGGALTPAGTLPGTQLAVGNAVIAGGMTALGGGDFEDIAKAAVLSGGMTYASAYVPSISKSIGEAIVGVNAPGAMTVGTAITNAGLNGIAAAILGQDPKKAMLAGAVSSVVQLNAGDFLKSTFGEDAFKNLSSVTNLSEKEMEGLVVRSISKGAGAMAYNRNFFTGFRDSLVSEGLSMSAANAATKSMAGKMDKDKLKKIHNVVRKTTQVAVVAKQRGLNPATVLQSIYPKIILDSLK